MTGEFVLRDEVAGDAVGGCEGRANSGYDDIAAGTSVTVYGANGDVIATGFLGLGEKDDVLGHCTFAISVDDVPTGEKFYKVEVSHRGTVQLSAEQAEAGLLGSVAKVDLVR
ncbi:hypothetical protein [Streptomyces solincola]|uniref:hypothetical protein n=1 Tax=Streptomyces solincola TaxID=2100817 RepID=UPI0015E39BED|nr:hypothetical protein [Streptomyces solincola]